MPRDHFIPQSLLKGFKTDGKVPWWDSQSRLHTQSETVADTAMVIDGNAVHDDIAEVWLRTENEWTDEFDTPMGHALHELHRSSWESHELATSALLVIHGAVSLPFRHPAATYERLTQTLAVQEALASAAGGAAAEYETAIATAFSISTDALAALGLNGHVLRHLAMTDDEAERSALEDIARGLLSMARLCLFQWGVRAWPKEVRIQRATGSARFQIADCGLCIHECIRDTWCETGDPQIWSDALSVADEAAMHGPRGRGRHLRLTLPVSSRLRILAEFRGQASGSDVGRPFFEEVDDQTVKEHNDLQFVRAAHWVYGDPH